MEKSIEDVLKSTNVVSYVEIVVNEISKYGDKQVMIREVNTSLLIWQAWDFQPDFMEEFEKQIEPYVIKPL